jgi:predicted amidohydrolase
MTSETIKIASWQGPVDERLSINLAKVESVLDQYRDERLDFICFPETYLSGYTVESIHANAIPLEDPRLQGFIEKYQQLDTVILVGMSERAGEQIYNSQLVIYRGQILGVYHKTLLTEFDRENFSTDLDLPVFQAKGICFGVVTCHDTSFVEPALYLRWKGARLLFTPHFNNLPPEGIETSQGKVSFWEHRSMVLNNQAALATLLKMVVVRSNIVMVTKNHLGTGESGIWDMAGRLVVSGEPFRESLIVGEFDKKIFLSEHWIDRREVPVRLVQMIAEAAQAYQHPNPDT